MRAGLGVIGFGAMGRTILRGGIEAGVIQPGDVIVAEPNNSRRADAAHLGCCVTGEVRFAMDAEQVLLALKPQVFPTVVRQTGQLAQPTVIISIMAGLSSALVRQSLGIHARVVRVMPNTPCAARAGISALTLGEGAREGDGRLAMLLFAALGRVIRVPEEHFHAVTALSGSGPAYVFLLAEAMEQAGVQMGLDPHAARALAYHTVHGAGRLLVHDSMPTAEALRADVTSPGGTTAAAMEVLFEREVPQIVTEAILAARDRGVELGEAPAQ